MYISLVSSVINIQRHAWESISQMQKRNRIGEVEKQTKLSVQWRPPSGPPSIVSCSNVYWATSAHVLKPLSRFFAIRQLHFQCSEQNTFGHQYPCQFYLLQKSERWRFSQLVYLFLPKIWTPFLYKPISSIVQFFPTSTLALPIASEFFRVFSSLCILRDAGTFKNIGSVPSASSTLPPSTLSLSSVCLSRCNHLPDSAPLPTHAGASPLSKWLVTSSWRHKTQFFTILISAHWVAWSISLNWPTHNWVTH